MLKKILFLLAIVIVNVTNAQVKPLNGSTLNYRIIGFQVPQNSKAATYTLQIALDSVVKADEFERRTIIVQKSSSNKIIETVPTFNMLYTWRVVCKDKAGKIVSKTPLYYFRTGYIKFIDPNEYKLKVLKNTIAEDDIFVLLDNSAVMYDLKGSPMWYLPKVPVIDSGVHIMRDLKPTADGTFTALFEHGIYEFDYDGNILWSGPLNGMQLLESSQTYHHEFTKLSNGHYMVAGNEIIENELPGKLEGRDTIETILKDGKRFRKSICGNILEYDKNGKLLWSWKSSSVFPSNDIAGFNNRRINAGTHMNSFYFDEVNSVIYVGFRNISKVLKIAYPSGKVLSIYNGKPPERDFRQGGERRPRLEDRDISNNEMFSSQHACRLEKGNLYIYNNNTMRSPDFTSYAEIYKEPDTAGLELKKVWAFPCNIDTNTTPGSPVGGSIYPINDSSLLVCMGGAGRVFIVNLDKELLWNAIPMFKRMDNEIKPLPQYRVSFLRKEDLSKFLFKY